MKKIILLLLIVSAILFEGYSQKALKINTPVALDSGDTTKAGGTVIITEVYMNMKGTVNDSIPLQIATEFYKSKNDYQAGKRQIRGMELFGNLHSLKIAKSQYNTSGNFENKIIAILQAYFETLYPLQTEVINL